MSNLNGTIYSPNQLVPAAVDSTTGLPTPLQTTGGQLLVAGVAPGASSQFAAVVTTYTCTTAFTNANIGDIITETQIINVTNTPFTAEVLWRNQTQQIDFGSAPSSSNITLVGTQGLTLAQLQSVGLGTSANQIAEIAYVAATSGATGTTSDTPYNGTGSSTLSAALRGIYTKLGTPLQINGTANTNSTIVGGSVNVSSLPANLTVNVTGTVANQSVVLNGGSVNVSNFPAIQQINGTTNSNATIVSSLPTGTNFIGNVSVTAMPNLTVAQSPNQNVTSLGGSINVTSLPAVVLSSNANVAVSGGLITVNGSVNSTVNGTVGIAGNLAGITQPVQSQQNGAWTVGVNNTVNVSLPSNTSLNSNLRDAYGNNITSLPAGSGTTGNAVLTSVGPTLFIPSAANLSGLYTTQIPPLSTVTIAYDNAFAEPAASLLWVSDQPLWVTLIPCIDLSALVPIPGTYAAVPCTPTLGINRSEVINGNSYQVQVNNRGLVQTTASYGSLTYGAISQVNEQGNRSVDISAVSGVATNGGIPVNSNATINYVQFDRLWNTMQSMVIEQAVTNALLLGESVREKASLQSLRIAAANEFASPFDSTI